MARIERTPISNDQLFDLLADLKQQALDLHAELNGLTRERLLAPSMVPLLQAAIRTADHTREHLRCSMVLLREGGGQ